MPHVDLLDLPYFEGISIDAVVSLVDMMEPKHFPTGSIIFQESDKAPPPLYIATAGKIVISKKSITQVGERNLAELDSPTLIGEIELFCQISPVHTARAATPVSAFVFTRAAFERLFEAQHPALMLFILNVARVACHRLAIADEMLSDVLEGEDLVTMRKSIFSRMSDGMGPTTTGVFRRP